MFLNRTKAYLQSLVHIQNEHKVHTPSPPTVQRGKTYPLFLVHYLIFFFFFSDPTQLESPRYNSRSFSLMNTQTSSLNGSTELLNSLTVEQLQKDISKLKNSMEDMKTKFTDQIQDLIHELDEEKKARANLQIELERLQKHVQKSARNPM